MGMALRIFFIAIALLGLLAAVQMGRIAFTQKQVFSAPPSYAIGPEDADLEVVEFIDYSCPFCQMAHPDILEAIKRDGKVRYYPKPLPSENERAMNAALFAYTAGHQGKFIEAHNFLISDFPNMTDSRLESFAKQLGLDMEQFEKDFQDEETHNQVMENGQVFLRYATERTPTFLIGRKMVYVPEGTMPKAEDFLRLFEEARERDK